MALFQEQCEMMNLFRQLLTARPGSRRRTGSNQSGVAVSCGNAELLETRALLSAGDLDPSFGIGGKVNTEFHDGTRTSSVALASALQADGAIVAAGEGGIARFLPNGSLDVTFGIDGRVEYPYAARSVAIQTDGKIVVAGGVLINSISTDLVVSRYLSNGTLDTTFDGDGHAITDFGNTGEIANDIVIQAHGRIVAVGSSNDSIAISRYTTTGALDTTFDGDGRFLRRFGTHRSDTAKTVAIQSDGRLVVAGTSYVDAAYNFINHDSFVMRLNQGGSLDRTFGGTGFVNTNFGSSSYSFDEARNLVIQGDGRIVVTGYARFNFNSYVSVARYNTDGTLDNDFDSDGYVLLPTADYTNGPTPGGEVAIVQADGKILTSTNGWLQRINVNGTADTAFSVGGVLKTALLQTDGKLVIGGTFLGQFGVARTDAAGVKDVTFSVDGIAVTEFGPGIDVAAGSALQTDGRIVVVGSSQHTFAVARYNSNGSLDTSFSQDGRTTLSFGGDVFEASATDVVIQPDGKIVIAGLVRKVLNQTGTSQMAVVRLNSNGSLDATFGGTGIVLTDLGGYGGAKAVALQSDGRIVVGGFGSGGYFTVVRYLVNGSLDRSFSGDGIMSLVSNGGGSGVNDLAILPDGRILAVGDYSPNYSGRYGSSLMMVRFNPNGMLDTTFGNNGRLHDSTNRQRTGNKIAMLPDGSFLVAGNATETRNNSTSSRMAVTRYDSNGNGAYWTAVETVLYASDSSPFQLPETNSTLRSMIVQPSGKIVLAGSSYAGLTMIRLNSSGERDTSFNGNGRTTTMFGPANSLYEDYSGGDLLQQPNGRLIAVGSQRIFGYPNPLDSDFVLARFLDAPTPAVSTTVSMNAAGSIEIRDLWSRNDQLEFRHVGSELWVTDLTQDSQAFFTVSGLPTVTGNGTKQIRIPVSVIAATGKPLIVNALGGDDSLVQFGSESAFGTAGFRFLGGLGNDNLRFENYITPLVWNLTSQGTGSVIPAGQVPRSITSVESIASGDGADEFRMTAGNNTFLGRIDGGGGIDTIRMTGNADMLLTSGFSNGLLTISGAISQRVAFRNIEEASLTGGAGNNVLDATTFSGPAKLYGQAGDDSLFGSQYDDILIGGPGNDLLVGYTGVDRLFGQAGSDILVGGGGADFLRGGDGEDLVIGGHAVYFDHYTDAGDRSAMVAAWVSAEAYADRVNQMLNTGVQGSDGQIKLTPTSTVFDDGEVDTLFGDASLDWFFAATTGPSSEIGLASGGLRDLELGEVLTLLNWT